MGLDDLSRWRIHDLGTLPGNDFNSATGINERGEIVGVSSSDEGGSTRVFLWKAGRMHDITAVDSVVVAHAWINDAGQVLETLARELGVNNTFV